MNRIKIITFVSFIALTTSHFSLANAEFSPSKRIEVYSLSQNYWDTQKGETLGEIVQKLLPYNKNMQLKLMQDIIELNPDAFLSNNPDHMQANKRLWLPNNMTKADVKVDQEHYQVQSFSWGNIKRPKR